MVSASKTKARILATLSTAAIWVSVRLSAAAAIGLALIPFIKWIPPFLAPQSTAAPVALVRAVPVPYLDTKPPEAAPPPSVSAKEATAKLLKVMRRTKAEQDKTEPKEPPPAPGKAEIK